MSWTNAPRLCCVPPDTRASVTRVPVVASRPFSTLSPRTHRQSPPAVNHCVGPNALDHCTRPPTLLVGTLWFSVIRPMLRGGVAAGTARKLLWNVSKSVKTVPCRLLSSGSTARTPPLPDFHRVSFASSVPSIVLALPLLRSSRKYPPRADRLTCALGR